MSRPNPFAVPTDRSRRHLLAACTGLALLTLGCAPLAHAEGRLVQVDIVDRDAGSPLRVWRDHGRPVVAGRPGARYAVRLTNRTGERVLAVVAIDGVNILTGETAASDQDGYVLGPYERASLTGWRKSHSEVAAFEFTALEDSYAARTGRPDDVGVIGVAVFRERVPAWRDARPDVGRAPGGDDERLARDEAAPRDAEPSNAPAAKAQAGATADADTARAPLQSGAEGRLAKTLPQPSGRLGTGHGAREFSYVTDTVFDRLASTPQEVVRYRYDSLANLVAAGIVPRDFAQALPGRPRAFPGDDAGFVPDPR
jgi:hypothetical protein